MQVNPSVARPIYERFLEKGTLGEGAVRVPMDSFERLETNVGYHTVVSNFKMMDDQPAYDKDAAPGQLNVPKANYLEFQVVQLKEMQQSGELPKEVNVESLRPELAAGMGNMNGSYQGSLIEQNAGAVRELTIQDTGNNTVEILTCTPMGSLSFEVKDLGQGKYEASVNNTIPKGEVPGYRETFVGDWNVTQ
jgi:hypothetical protein